jgi:DNA-binding LacI/PurR family transcriptional regulator
VSAKTVSRVVNDDPAVAPATAARVRSAIRELGFHPNPVARSLRVGRDDAVGLVVEDLGRPVHGRADRRGRGGGAGQGHVRRRCQRRLRPRGRAGGRSGAGASLGVVRALHHCGRTELAHVSFDDFAAAESLAPPVTAILQDPRRLGHRAAELLFDRVNGLDGPPRRVLQPVRLIVRGSGELPPPTG